MSIYIQEDWILKANISILDPHFKMKKKRLDRSWKNRLFNKCGRILCLFLYYLLKFKDLFKTNRLFPGYDLINLKAFNWTNTMTRFYVYNEDADLCISGVTRLTLCCVQREMEYFLPYQSTKMSQSSTTAAITRVNWWALRDLRKERISAI